MFASPFAEISQKIEKKLTFSVFYLLLITIVAMRYFDTYLTNKITSTGIISFELASLYFILLATFLSYFSRNVYK
jgi:hypothetical protein